MRKVLGDIEAMSTPHKISAKEMILNYKKDLLNEKLSQCTDEQQDFFNRMYPNSVPDDRLEWAIQQCLNTIEGKL